MDSVHANIRCFQVLEGHLEAVLALAVSAQHLVSGSYDTTVRFWDLQTFRCVRKCDGHQDAVRVLAARADEDEVYSGSYDGCAWCAACTTFCLQLFPGLLVCGAARLLREGASSLWTFWHTWLFCELQVACLIEHGIVDVRM